MFHDTITLLSQVGSVAEPVFVRTVLHNVSLDGAFAANANTPLQDTADRAVLIIPLHDAIDYVPYYRWDALDEDAQACAFTIQPGDVFARGEYDATTPQALLAQGGFVVTTVDEKNTNSALAHLAVGAGATYRYGGGLA